MTQQWKVLILSTVWPEPSSSAAGVRQMQWIQFFLSLGAQVVLGSPSKLKNSQDWGFLNFPESVTCVPFPLNQSEVQEVLIQLKPDIVMFDRFIVEEQFGHFVYASCPEALVLLETQDLHLVRRARDAVKEQLLTLSPIPKVFFETETALRETASLGRVDHAFVCSTFEKALLSDQFGFKEDQFSYLPFFYEEPILESEATKSFSEREGFVWIGNFRHAPNLEGLRWFRNAIWPEIKSKLPQAMLKIYGAYPSEEVMQWHKPKEGIRVLGSLEDLSEVFKSARVNLAPLRFGAGIKGKILEGLRRGVPAVSTWIGAEGLGEVGSHLGIKVANSEAAFAEACVSLHENEFEWKRVRDQGMRMMEKTHSLHVQAGPLQLKLNQLVKNKKEGILPRWSSRILRHETLNSHRYFSRWIELKEKILEGSRNKL